MKLEKKNLGCPVKLYLEIIARGRRIQRRRLSKVMVLKGMKLKKIMGGWNWKNCRKEGLGIVGGTEKKS